MQKQSFAHPVLSMHRIIAISIGLLSTILLASCGGGGSTDPNATAQSADDGTKTIQAVSGSTAVPGTWTGRAPKMEVINGITVPPEPAPAINNATLAGVDVNNNGVRDDVERVIAAKLPISKNAAANSYARTIQKGMIAPTTDPSTAKKQLIAMNCAQIGSEAERLVVASSVNNQQRILAYRVSISAAGMILGSELECAK